MGFTHTQKNLTIVSMKKKKNFSYSTHRSVNWLIHIWKYLPWFNTVKGIHKSYNLVILLCIFRKITILTAQNKIKTTQMCINSMGK